ncbi:MAG: SMP-30/gluconolactonase/LRE family protein, partial [Actinomycetota bacterium]
MEELKTLTAGIQFGESPRWHDGRLWFSDWTAGELLAVDLNGGRELVCRVPSFPFCFDWLPDGRLLVVSGREGLVLRREPDGTLVTHADLRDLSSAPWNEIVVDGAANAYVNTIGFDFPGGEYRPGSVARVSPGGTTRLVAGDLAFPNGMALAANGSMLLVAESYAHCLTAFDVSAAGELANRRVWAVAG